MAGRIDWAGLPLLAEYFQPASVERWLDDLLVIAAYMNRTEGPHV